MANKRVIQERETEKAENEITS